MLFLVQVAPTVAIWALLLAWPVRYLAQRFRPSHRKDQGVHSPA